MAGNLRETAQLKTLQKEMSRVLKNCATGAEATGSETEEVLENTFGDNTPGPSAGWVGDEEPEWQWPRSDLKQQIYFSDVWLVLHSIYVK